MNPTDYFDDFCRRYSAYKNGSWCYEDGCVYRGLLLLHEATGEQRWLDHLIRLCGPQVAADGALTGYDPDEFNIDNILAGRVLLPLERITGEKRYRLAARRLIDQLDRHPRIACGNYWHKKRYPHQLWLDGLYMGLPFQTEYALASGQTERIDDVLRQFSTALALTDAGNGLHVHGYDDSRKQEWADPVSGQSAAVWARAMGWLAMALIDVLSILPHDPLTEPLRESTAHTLASLLDLQQPSGLWLQVLDVPGLRGNYEESSASAMFSYALLRAAGTHLVDEREVPRLKTAGLRAIKTLEEQRLVETSGKLRLEGICLVAGLGALSGVYRDGSPEYYLTEAVVADDPKGVGPFMMAWAEHLRTLETAVPRTGNTAATPTH